MAYFNNEDYRHKKEQDKKQEDINKTINFILKKLDDKFNLATILFECSYLNEIEDFIKMNWENMRTFTDEKNQHFNFDMSYDYFVKRIKDHLKSKYKLFTTQEYVKLNKTLNFWGKKFESFSNIEIKVYDFMKEDKRNLYNINPQKIETLLEKEENALKEEKQNLEKETNKKGYKKDNLGRINFIEKMINCSEQRIEELNKTLDRALAIKKIYPIYEDYLLPHIEKFMEIKVRVDEHINGTNIIIADEERKELIDLIQNSFKGESIGIERFF